jgi:hypothetical protein
VNNNKFRLKSDKVFMTISNVPHRGLIDSIIRSLIKREKHLYGGLVAEEAHASGAAHYHIGLVYKKRKAIVSHEYYNYILDKQASMEPMASLSGSIDYIEKAGTFQYFGKDIKLLLKSTTEEEKKLDESAENTVLDLLGQGMTPEELYKTDSLAVKRYILKNSSRLYKAYEMMCNIRKHNAELNKTGIDPNTINIDQWSNGKHRSILGFIKNALELKYNRPLKASNLHIFSEHPNFGKTTFLRNLSEQLPVYWYPPINWFKEYKNEIYSLIIWDEFRLKGWDNSLLNRFLEGSPCDLPIKHAYTTKQDNPLVLLCSNMSIRNQVLTKLGYTCCTCNLPNNSKYLCINQKGDCRTNIEMKTMYETLKARVTEIELIDEGDMLFDLGKIFISQKQEK